jgi:C4-type Zn-finger protein
MVKIIDCPLCNGGKLKIQISNGYEIAFNGAMKDLPSIVRCKNCNRNVKYKVVKEGNEVKKQ